jgi:NAD(P)-dependent dehydrogenase (short-subunit alcohol dehydrogenase family)
MDTIIVTGGAGFIGANFVRYVLKKSNSRVVVVDKLTYAGNLASLKDVENDRRYAFVRGDIADRGKMDALIKKFRPFDRRSERFHRNERCGCFRAARSFPRLFENVGRSREGARAFSARLNR